jgi:3-deoxy-D-manno-octulosonic-acid transferase
MQRATIIIYDLIWMAIAPIIPLLLRWRGLRNKEDSTRYSERYGYPSRTRPAGDSPIYWLHSASVGESVSALALAKAMLDLTDDAHVLITSGTLTSAQMLDQRIHDMGLSHRIIHQFHPYDHPVWVTRFLDHWRPDLVVMLESEIWPNMAMLSAKRGLPVAMASAQISAKSVRLWSSIGRILGGIVFPAFDKIIAVSEDQKARFDNLPTRPGAVMVGGSMKTAAPALKDNPDLHRTITEAANGRMVVLLASSHDGDETIFLQAMEAINQNGGFYSIIAPRHINRGDAIKQMAATKGLTAGQHQQGEPPAPHQQVWVADMMGEMGGLIRAADIIVLGGAFGHLGGHNPMEMAALSKGVISGGNTFKNTAAFTLLAQHNGLITAAAATDIADAITILASSPTSLAKHNQGAATAYQGVAAAAVATATALKALTLKAKPSPKTSATPKKQRVA